MVVFTATSSFTEDAHGQGIPRCSGRAWRARVASVSSGESTLSTETPNLGGLPLRLGILPKTDGHASFKTVLSQYFLAARGSRTYPRRKSTTTPPTPNNINILLNSAVPIEHVALPQYPSLGHSSYHPLGEKPTMPGIIVGVDIIVWKTDYGVTTYEGRKLNKPIASVDGPHRKWAYHYGAPFWEVQGVKLMFSLSVRLLVDGASACNWGMRRSNMTARIDGGWFPLSSTSSGQSIEQWLAGKRRLPYCWAGRPVAKRKLSRDDNVPATCL